MTWVRDADRESFGREVLPDILDWIADNLYPDQIWDEERLLIMITEDMPDLWNMILEYIDKELNPEDVFSGDKL